MARNTDEMNLVQQAVAPNPSLRSVEPTTLAPTILIVDDDPVVRSLMQDSLEDEGFLVLEAEDGVEAIVLAGTELPLLLRESGISGIEFLDTTVIHVDAIVDELLR